MRKLLSRFKHEEFESDLALQIRDEKERRAENAKNLELQEIPTRTVHAADTIHQQPLFTCFLTPQIFVTIFCFFRYYHL